MHIVNEEKKAFKPLVVSFDTQEEVDLFVSLLGALNDTTRERFDVDSTLHLFKSIEHLRQTALRFETHTLEN